MNYDYGPAREFCKSLGMGFDEAGMKLADDVAKKAGLTQAQFDEAIKLHATRVKFLFTPSNYGWKGRFAIAAYFLGLVRL